LADKDSFAGHDAIVDDAPINIANGADERSLSWRNRFVQSDCEKIQTAFRTREGISNALQHSKAIRPLLLAIDAARIEVLCQQFPPILLNGKVQAGSIHDAAIPKDGLWKIQAAQIPCLGGTERTLRAILSQRV